jgi:microcystin-dependent protein
MSQPYLGQIEAFPYNFVPKNWLACAGQLLPINQYQALFALVGTTYGGNGTTNFQLPDLRGRVALGQGNGGGLTPRVTGEILGETNHTLLVSELPTHIHTMAAASTAATTSDVATPGPSVVLANPTYTVTVAPPPPDPTTAAFNLYATGTANTPLDPTAIGLTGGSQPHPNMMPYLALQFCIAMSGIFPSRN